MSQDQLELEEMEVFRGVRKKVKELLEEKPELRNSDRAVAWEYWKKFDNVVTLFYQDSDGKTAEMIDREDFVKNSTSFNTIERAARRIRHLCPWLKGNDLVEEKRECKRKATRKFFKNY